MTKRSEQNITKTFGKSTTPGTQQLRSIFRYFLSRSLHGSSLKAMTGADMSSLQLLQ